MADRVCRLTYGELNRWANRLAHHLQALGVGPDVPVAVLAGRSAAEVVAELAVLKAGGCFVPLDPAHPAQRVADTVEESGAEVLLAVPELLAMHEGLRSLCAHLVPLEPPAGSAPEDEIEPPGLAAPQNLAYIIYTSGSTGRPKGVEVSRSALASFTEEMVEFYSIAPEDRSSRSASPAFDASMLELWPVLAAGASIHVPEREVLLSPRQLIDWLAAERITLSFATTALAETLLAQSWPRGLALRCMITGGETLRRWAPADLPFALFNVYGPTEATVLATGGRVPRPPRVPEWRDGSMAAGSSADEPAPRFPSIGSPLSFVTVRLVDRLGAVVAAGEAGEIAIGGNGVARGYRGEAAKTAAVFTPDPAGEPGARLYRSGDLGRWLADGAIDFLGRIDNQVKIRGFRVEPGEVEVALLGHPQVATAVVLAVERGGKPALAAFAAAAEGASAPEAAQLRRYLAERLPPAMVPATLEVLAALPLNASFKVDRAALQARATAQPDAGESMGTEGSGGAGIGGGTAAASPTEERLARIFAEVLALPQLGRDDDFMELGGHSLLVTRVCSRVRHLFGVELPVAAVYEAPTPARLALYVERARAEQGEGATAGAAGEAGIEPLRRSPAAPVELSFAQERLWFLDRFLDSPAVYNVPFEVSLEGPLVPAALAAVLSQVVERHEVLRTALVEVDGRPVGKPVAVAAVPLPTVDLSTLASQPAAAAYRALTTVLARRPFDLASPPLARFALVRFGTSTHSSARHSLLGNLHHVVCDGWSMAVLLDEVAAGYQAGLAADGGPRPQLAEPAVQYADYAHWQRARMRGPLLEGQLDYWRQELAGAPSSLDLPTDRPRAVRESTRGARVVEVLEPAQMDRLAAYGRSTDSSLYVTLLAGLAALLGRSARLTDLVIGCPIANRHRLETEGMIGFFVNTLPLRADLSGDPSFLGLTAQLRGRVLGAHEHQDVPFERLVEELAPERGSGLNPLVSVLLVLQNAPAPLAELAPATSMAWRELPTGEAIADISLIAEERDGGLELIFDYRSDLWDETSIRRLAAAYRRCLAAAVAQPELPLSELPLASAAERHQVLLEWNDTAVAPPAEPFPHRQAAGWSAATPDAVAVVDGDRHLSWAKLDRRAEELALVLRRLGVAPERRVGLWLDRSAEMVVAMLAVLKAGGCFVPLDPIYPDQRGEQMLNDAAALAVIFRRGGVRQLGRFGGAVLEIDASDVRLTRPALEPVAAMTPSSAVEDDPSRLAYLIFTSGSTGVPKGVGVSHGSLANLTGGHRRAFGLGADDRTSLLAGPAFDGLLWEAFPALTGGARLEIVDEKTRVEPAALMAWLERRKLTLSFVPTPIADLILAEGMTPPPALRALTTGGDRLHRLPAPARPWPLFNIYGPTENTIASTAGAVAPDAGGREPSIGRPIAGVCAYLLDPAARLVPAGVPGELCLGGVGVARGYLGRPGRTAVSFVPDPFGAQPGARMYRSGDLARWRSDGELEFLGRIDTQVKVRGFRIELGEIESRLASHPAIAEAAAVAVGDGAGKRLVAYWVPAAGAAASPDSAELASYLAQHLPEYMVPAVFERLDRMPLTPSAKVDRRELTARSPQPETGSRRAPETALEQAVAAIWCEVLGLDAVGLDDDFFRLGGHSLAGVQVQSRLRSALGAELSLPELFGARSLAALARRVEAVGGGTTAGGADAGSTQVIARREPGTAVPPSFAQSRLWFLDRLDPGRPVYNVPIALTLEGALSVPTLARALREIERRHEALRTVFEQRDGDPFQVVLPPSLVLPVIDLGELAHPQPAAEALTASEARWPFNLVSGPLIRTRLLRLSARRHRLLVTTHHITSDGWSVSVFVRELEKLYAAFTQGGRSPLAELPVQYADFSIWQRAWLTGNLLDEQLGFWRRRLAALPPSLDLPFDHPRPPTRSLRGAMVARPLADDLQARLTAFAHAHGVTPFMVAQAAFVALLGRYAQQERFATGTPVANRHPAEVEALIGFFANTLVLVADLSGAPSFAELVERTREDALLAYAHQDLPFERLVEESGAERDLSRSPIFNVVLTLDTDIPHRVAFGAELTGTVLTLHQQTSKFDLSLFLHQRGSDFVSEMEYSSDLFERGTVERLLVHYETLLGGALGEPERVVWDLPLLSDAECRQLAAWEEGPGSTPPEPLLAADTLVGLFLAQAQRTPRATALVVLGERWSYAELRARVEALAAQLQGAGLGPNQVAAILLPRGASMVVAMLAAQAAGAAYLPLDPDYPVDRLAYMLADSGAAVVLSSAAVADRMPAGETPVVDVERPSPAATAALAPRAATESHLSHLIYTSGSTGRPKGVAIRQESAVAMVRWAATVFGPEELAGALAATSICFDLSVFEIFLPLAMGGTVILAEDALALRELPARDEVRLVNTVPSALTALLRVDGLPAGVRTVNLAGEPLPKALADAAYAVPTVQRVFNLYGPSEDTTYSTYDLVERDGELAPTIGRPVTGSQAYVVDRRLQRVPAGMPGELVLGGRGLARGYHRRPRLTAASFVPNPFAAEGAVAQPGSRLYRTGDRVRWRADGRLEFLGRLDAQIKLRGFRIEIGEVESALRRCAGVREAVVGVREMAGELRLVGWVVGAATVAQAQLRKELATWLPTYMIPAAIVVLEALPLTPNGKIDRGALPSPEASRQDGTRAFVAPRTPFEELVAELWAEVLGLDQVGVQDSFFALGGHSLAATKVIAQLEEMLDLEIPLKLFFEAPTIELLIDALGRLAEMQDGEETGVEVAAAEPLAAGATGTGGVR